MSATPVEAVEPDAAATSLHNDETVNKQEEFKTETEVDIQTQTNGSVQASEEKASGEQGNTEVTKKEDDNSRGQRKPFQKRTYEKRENNSKYDPSVLEKTDDHKQIRAQVEFYFGDANLPTDDFLWEQTGGEDNREVPVDTIHKFGRMRRFQPREAVVAALKESKSLVISGEEGHETIKRKIAYDPSVGRGKYFMRSVYVKGFGDEEPSSQFDIEAFFAPYGPINAIRLRRTPDKAFKGSVFVEFAEDGQAEKFLALDPKPKWKNDVELEVKSKKEYVDGKNEDIKAGRMQPAEARSVKPRGGGRGGRGDRGNSRGGRGRGGADRRERGDRDPDDWKRRRDDDRANGFKDDRKGRGGRGGRGDRGGQRGGRRGGREGSSKDQENKEGDSNTEVTAETPVKQDKTEEPATNDKKRAREDDGDVKEQPEAKKQIVESEAS